MKKSFSSPNIKSSGLSIRKSISTNALSDLHQQNPIYTTDVVFITNAPINNIAQCVYLDNFPKNIINKKNLDKETIECMMTPYNSESEETYEENETRIMTRREERRRRRQEEYLENVAHNY